MLNFLLLLALSAAAAAPARRLDPHHQSGDLLDPHHHSGRHDSELEYMEMDMGCGPGGKVADFLPATPMAICIGGNQPLYKTADDALLDSGATSAHVMTFGEYDLYMPTGVPDVVMAMCMDGKPDSTCSASAKATGVGLPDYTGEVYPSKGSC